LARPTATAKYLYPCSSPFFGLKNKGVRQAIRLSNVEYRKDLQGGRKRRQVHDRSSHAGFAMPGAKRKVTLTGPLQSSQDYQLKPHFAVPTTVSCRKSALATKFHVPG
jgi:hypothetical protein